MIMIYVSEYWHGYFRVLFPHADCGNIFCAGIILLLGWLLLVLKNFTKTGIIDAGEHSLSLLNSSHIKVHLLKLPLI